MSDLLEALQRLQNVELKLADLRKSEETKLRRIQAQQRQLKQVEDKLEQSQAVRLGYQMEIDRLSLEVTSREDSINKHREALSRAKTNKEYSAILTALNTEKADNAKFETEVLELMEKTSQINDANVAVEAEKEQIQARIARIEEDLAKYREKTADKRGTLEAERATASHDIPPTTLNTFARVAERHEGEALAEVNKIHPRSQEFICSGCNMKVTLEVVNALRTREEMQTCKICGRILYVANGAKA